MKVILLLQLLQQQNYFQINYNNLKSKQLGNVQDTFHKKICFTDIISYWQIIVAKLSIFLFQNIFYCTSPQKIYSDFLLSFFI